MKLKDFLADNKIINQAQLAKLLWPENKSANTKLANKLSETAGQRITEKDIEDVRRVLKYLCSVKDKISL